MAEAVFAWISNVSGASVSGIEDLKSGAVLCNTVNAMRAGTIRQVSTYKAAYACMKNIDSFLKVAEKVGVAKEDRFAAEDLYYENNIPKVILTLTLFADAAAAKFGVDGLSTGGVDELRAAAASGQNPEGKKRQKYTGLGIFDSNAKGFQDIASEEARTKNKLVKKDMQDHAITSELGLFQADQVDKQTMISKAKSSGQDLIIMSREEAAVTGDLGMFQADQVDKQTMISKAKASGQDLIIRSREEAAVTGDLGMFQADQVDKQVMISKAKASGQDLIIKSREEAAVTGDLGFIDSEARHKQNLASGAHQTDLDLIIKQGDVEEEDGDF